MGYSEKRKYPRIQAPVPCQVSLGPTVFSTRTRNISCGGALCRMVYEIPVMTKLEITLNLPEVDGQSASGPIRCGGVVVRQEKKTRSKGGKPSYLTAIYFSDLCQTDRRRIAEFVLQSMLAHRRATSSEISR